jgi:hypothetical protein
MLDFSGGVNVSTGRLIVIQLLPPDVQAVVKEFRTCEFTTLSKAGMPVTWPVSTHFMPDQGHFLMTTSIGFPQKAYNIRRNPRVSLLFSNPTGSGLTQPPAVLIQGDAKAPDNLVVSVDAASGLRDYWHDSIFSRQPGSYQFTSNALMRSMMDWLYMRIIITIVPRAVYWWAGGDFSQPAQKLEAVDVA